MRSIDGLPGEPIDVHHDASGVALSPDGQFLAVAGLNTGLGEIPVVDTFRVADGTRLPSFLHTTHGSATGAVFSPDGTRLAATTNLGNTGALTVYRTDDRALLWTSGLRNFGPIGLARGAPTFSPDGALVAIPDRLSGARVFASDDGTLVADLPAPNTGGVAFTPTGDRLALATETGLRIYRTHDWSLQAEIPGAFRSVASSPTGPTLVAGGLDGSVRMWCDAAAP